MATLDPIRLFFATNDAYAQHLATCLVSLLQNTPHRQFEAIVAATGLLDLTKVKLSTTLQQFRNLNYIIKDVDISRFALTFPVSEHISIETYIRFFIADLVDANIMKILYMDCDTVAVGSVDELWETNVSECLFAAVEDPAADRWADLNIPREHKYFNAGVLLINLSKWRTLGFGNILIRYMEERKGKLKFWDQDALNACAYDKWSELPYRWNFQVRVYQEVRANVHLKMSYQQVRKEAVIAKILHYNGAAKPWVFQQVNPLPMRFVRPYFRYLNKTAWAGFRPHDATRMARLFDVWYRMAPFVWRQRFGRLAQKGLRFFR
jgi:lipopolysaccharide biosynthesis glycosyltransferase